MPASKSAAEKVSLESFASQCKGQMIPLSNAVSYFSALPLKDDERRRLLDDPASAVPPKVSEILPNLRVVLVPYLEEGRAGVCANPTEAVNGSTAKSGRNPKAAALVTFQRPAASRRRLSARLERDGQIFLFLALSEEEVADCHYQFFLNLASLISERAATAALVRFCDLLREELQSQARGELDEKSWRIKEQLTRRQSDFARDTKLLKSYFRQALEDTLTLYLHGLCCDIDVDRGPRQLASRHIRRRLLLLRELLPPPAGFALFPEELPGPRRQ